MTNEEIEQKIIELEREIRAARRAWRIDYDEITERLDNLAFLDTEEVVTELTKLRKVTQELQDKLDDNKTNKP